tara:strand:- start:227 stop:514 length:288 start_codon:yes stop_codon:yes gene_type:complete
MKRKVPIISLEDFETKSKKRIVLKSLVDNISMGVKSNLESVNIAEIKNQDIFISVPKTEWKAGLENAIDYYIEKEEYEECSKIQKIIESIKNETH